MFKLRITILAIALCGSTLVGGAQQDQITVDTKPTAKDIQSWLNSGDPRLVAWGGYFAREHGDADAISAMVRLVEDWTPPEDAQNTLGRSQIDAMREVLDALIQRNEQVFPAGLNAIASSFPRQAIILSSRLPLAEAGPFFIAWYEKRNSKDLAAFPRIAAMMLAKAPPPGFAASILAESEEDLEVMVESNWTTGHGYGSGGGSCGDSMGVTSPSGWPPFFDYSIEETTGLDRDPTIAEAGGDRITYHRVSLSSDWGSCSLPRPLNARTRHRLLAELLGVVEENMQWKAQEPCVITWENREQFSSELRQQVASEEAKLHTTANALYAKKLLTEAESESVRPKLSVTVTDYREPENPPLPRLNFSDPRTTITYKQPSD